MVIVSIIAEITPFSFLDASSPLKPIRLTRMAGMTADITRGIKSVSMLLPSVPAMLTIVSPTEENISLNDFCVSELNA